MNRRSLRQMRRLLVIVSAALLSLFGTVSLVPATPAPQAALDLQQRSVERQMESVTTVSAQQQLNSIQRQAESLRNQSNVASSGAFASSSQPAALTAKPLNTKPPPASAESSFDVAGLKSPRQGFYLIPWPGALALDIPNVRVPASGCDSLPDDEVDVLVRQASAQNRLDASLLRAVMFEESGFRPCAVSTAGAMGLMQIMPETAAELGLQDPFDPEANVEAGARYLKRMLQRYNGNTALALAAYNTGPGRTDRASGVPEIAETIGYVSRILGSIPLF